VLSERPESGVPLLFVEASDVVLSVQASRATTEGVERGLPPARIGGDPARLVELGLLSEATLAFVGALE
jgi:hypothetical protein